MNNKSVLNRSANRSDGHILQQALFRGIFKPVDNGHYENLSCRTTPRGKSRPAFLLHTKNISDMPCIKMVSIFQISLCCFLFCCFYLDS